MRDPLAKARARVERLAHRVPAALTREDLRRMTDEQLDALLMSYVERAGLRTVEELKAALAGEGGRDESDRVDAAGPPPGRKLGPRF